MATDAGIYPYGDQVIVLVFQAEKIVPKKFVEQKRCRKTGKIQYESAIDAIELLKHWRQRDPSVCWDKDRMRIYQCEYCNKFHLGRYHG